MENWFDELARALAGGLSRCEALWRLVEFGPVAGAERVPRRWKRSKPGWSSAGLLGRHCSDW